MGNTLNKEGLQHLAEILDEKYGGNGDLKIGELENLYTDEKNSIVGAINEIVAKHVIPDVGIEGDTVFDAVDGNGTCEYSFKYTPKDTFVPIELVEISVSNEKFNISESSTDGFTLSVTNVGEDAEEETTVVAKLKLNGKEKTITAGTKAVFKSSVPKGFVDLDLPSGRLWADKNLGADAPHEDGLYFQWGATDGHAAGEGYNFASGNYPEAGISGDLTDAQDAASVMLGNGCRIPSKEDFAELAANCHMERVTNYNGTGVAGLIFYSCKDNTTGKGLYNSAGTWYAWSGSMYESYTSKPADFVPYTLDTPHIFFPASGCGTGTSLYSRAASGRYWSRSYNTSSNAYYFYFGKSYVYPQGDNSRYYGNSVRPCL